MTNILVTIEGLNNIDKMLNQLQNNKTNSEINEYLKNKVLNAYIDIMNQSLSGGTSNDRYISLYKSSYHVEDTKNGFILYNDANIPQQEVNAKNKQSYPKGFSIAMAFEYGVGIVGVSTGNTNSWEYNIHKYKDGWKYIDENGVEQFTAGHLGFEIFRKTVEQVNRDLDKWIKEYYGKELK